MNEIKYETRTSLFYDPTTGITTRREFECAVPTACEYNFDIDNIDDTDRRAMNRNNGAGICPNEIYGFASPLASLN
jgi:hypothetical protein